MGILILFLLVFVLSYMSKTELREETERGKNLVGTTSGGMTKGDQTVEEKTEHEGMKMEEEKEIETPQSPKRFTGVQISPEKQQI